MTVLLKYLDRASISTCFWLHNSVIADPFLLSSGESSLLWVIHHHNHNLRPIPLCSLSDSGGNSYYVTRSRYYLCGNFMLVSKTVLCHSTNCKTVWRLVSNRYTAIDPIWCISNGQLPGDCYFHQHVYFIFQHVKIDRVTFTKVGFRFIFLLFACWFFSNHQKALLKFLI